MGQAASYAESALQRALVKQRTEQHASARELDEYLASFTGPVSCGGDGSSSSPCTPTPSEDNLHPDFYTLDELRATLQHLPDALLVSLHRITLLYLLDRDGDGRFSASDVARFTDWAIAAVPPHVSQDILAETLQAQAALSCWHLCLVQGQRMSRKAATRSPWWSSRQRRDGGGAPPSDNLELPRDDPAVDRSTNSCPTAGPSGQAFSHDGHLQAPITGEDRQQAARHFAAWALSLLHAQELGRRQAGGLRRATLRKYELRYHQRCRRWRRSDVTPKVMSASGSSEPLTSGRPAGMALGNDDGLRRSAMEAAADRVLLVQVLSTLPSPPPLPMPATHSTSTSLVKGALPEKGMSRMVVPTPPLSGGRALVSLPEGEDRGAMEAHVPVATPPSPLLGLSPAEASLLDDLLIQDAMHYEQLYAAGWCTVGAVEELYLDLGVRESYGLSFWAFCRRLHEHSAVEVEAALGLTLDEAVREITCAVDLEEARERVAWREVQLRRERAGPYGGPTPTMATTETHSVSSVPSFIVSKYTLLCFLQYFVKAYWEMLESMGFNPLHLPVEASSVTPPVATTTVAPGSAAGASFVR